MFDKVAQFFKNLETHQASDYDEISTRELEIACCVLLLEIAFVDLSFPLEEQGALLGAIAALCKLDNEEAEDLLDLAEVVRVEREKISPFLAAVNARLTVAQKQVLYATVWHVIKADSRVHLQELRAVTSLGACLSLSVDDEIQARRMVIEKRWLKGLPV